MGWPDHGVPEGKAVLDFELMLNYFIEWTLKSAGNEKAIVNFMNCTCYDHPLDPEIVKIKLMEAMKTKEKFQYKITKTRY